MTENNKTAGKWLVVVDDDTCEYFWAAHAGIALAFMREQAAVISAQCLSELLELYQQERDDADARVNGDSNRWDQEERDRREAYRIRAAKKQA